MLVNSPIRARPEDQLQPEDTLVDRGVRDVLDEGYSPLDHPYPRRALGTSDSIDELLRAEVEDPAARVNSPLDAKDQQLSDEAELHPVVGLNRWKSTPWKETS